MTNVVSFLPIKPLEQRNVSPYSVQRVLLAAGLNAQLFDDGTILIGAPGCAVSLTIAGDPVFKIFYSTSRKFKSKLPLQKRLSLANRLNRHIIGGIHVSRDELSCAATLTYAGGVLPNTISNTVIDFRTLFEEFLEKEHRGELRP